MPHYQDALKTIEREEEEKKVTHIAASKKKH
jgi:hypothetical protein